MGIFTKSIGVDCGTSFIRICRNEKDGVFSEPAVAAIDGNSGKVVSVGKSADEMLGRTPDNLMAVRPIKGGVVADYDVACEILKRCITLAVGKRRVKHLVTVAVPGCITDVETRALRSVFLASGAKNVQIINTALAAAIGAGADVNSSAGNMIIDIGAGTAEIAVICMGEIVCGKSLRIAGDNFDIDIKKYIKNHYGLNIGEKVAEEVKRAVGSVCDEKSLKEYTVRGREAASGLPGSAVVNSAEVGCAISKSVQNILEAVRAVFEQTPYELISDISENGIILTGGSFGLKGLCELISSETGIKARIADNCVTAVVRGCASAFSEFS